MSFRSRYTTLIQRHLARSPRPSDGCTEAAIAKTERRLDVRLPESLREYFLIAGRLDRLNKAHNWLYSLAELRIADSHLWFMEENQSVAFWGLPIQRLASRDPVVHQRANNEDAQWYSEKLPFSAF